jgi:2-isopropylmalate synthase
MLAKYAKKDHVHTGIGTSESHIVHKLNTTREDIIVEQSLQLLMLNLMWRMWSFMLKMPEELIMILARVCEEAIKSGATVLNT